MSRAKESVYPLNTENVNNGGSFVPQMGLTVREHFSILALQAIIGTAAAPCLTDALGGAEAHAARSAIKIADALIAELAK